MLLLFLKKQSHAFKIDTDFVHNFYAKSQNIQEPSITHYNQISITGTLL